MLLSRYQQKFARPPNPSAQDRRGYACLGEDIRPGVTLFRDSAVTFGSLRMTKEMILRFLSGLQ